MHFASLSWQRCHLDKMAQHTVQPNLHYPPGEIIPLAGGSHCETFSSCAIGTSSGVTLYPLSLSLFHATSGKKGVSIFSLNSGTW